MSDSPTPKDAKTRRAQERLLALYERWMHDPSVTAFYGHSDYFNYGYSTLETRSQREACENLVEKLLDFVPEKQGSILDVACGLGATTRQLLNYYQPASVTGINISESQLARARQNAPGCRFLDMNAVDLDFPDASFDSIICVEAAFHFNTREQFLREALRVLKPGGRLVLSDILGWQSKDNQANVLDGPLAYRELLIRVGFDNPQVVDATQESLRSCGRRLQRWPGEEWRAGRLNFSEYARGWLFAHLYALFMRYGEHHYLLAVGQKPD